MRQERVVITGMGAVSVYGAGTEAFFAGLFGGRCGLRLWEAARAVNGLESHVAGRIDGVSGQSLPREMRRSMSSMSVHACLAAEEALAGLDAGQRRETGVAIGSTMGSPDTLNAFFADFLPHSDISGIRSMVFFKVMSHTAASNVALACGCGGRQTAPSAACASGLLAMGLGYEAIAAGREVRMLCGGADELHPLVMAAFDRIGAASHCPDPRAASRPFDRRRDGIVCSEGAGVLLLESLTAARQRNATILGEVTGFAANTSLSGPAFPDVATVEACMRRALADAGLAPHELACVNAHATGTEAGDMAEGQAIAALCGHTVPVTSFKGVLGHTLAASGPLESLACLEMWRRQCCLPTVNLTDPDPACGALHHVREMRPLAPGPVLKNCFGLGGCNTALVLQPYEEC